MICENCKKSHTSDYGSKRFCSSFCAKSFSTKNKRKQINEKISESLSGRKIANRELRKCEMCDTTFECKTSSTKRFCSRSCSGKYAGLSPKKDTSAMGGLRKGGGRSKSKEYINSLGNRMFLNEEEIRVAKILDSLNINWNRNSVGFKYLTEDNKVQKFYPDFYIEDFDIYIEYKGWITRKMDHKMKDSVKRNDFNLLIIYGDDPRYSKLGLNITEFENDPLKKLNGAMV